MVFITSVHSLLLLALTAMAQGQGLPYMPQAGESGNDETRESYYSDFTGFQGNSQHSNKSVNGGRLDHVNWWRNDTCKCRNFVCVNITLSSFFGTVMLIMNGGF